MRFLFVEGLIGGSNTANALDTGNISFSQEQTHELAEILDFIEQNPDSPLKEWVPFWGFITTEIWPPDRQIIEHEKRIDPGARFLEVYELLTSEPLWDEQRCSDRVAVETFRCVSPVYAFVPLRRCRPTLRLVHGQV
ncbi:hypothetical protein [Parasulfitobacter algicola]|uniref:Uncharacterized protein n=1 Tax=Parasulfitobacter algicola TaxID=2614809 RepID=A0ABX2IWR0_9RHOB|nr:hypothetical protein [Sulfitobacter algicola]NSX56810.1 hypothetical protein [Sulfitobacter algicola]